MRQPAWQFPVKRKGESLVPVTLKLPRPFVAALREYAQLETERLGGRRVSQSTILVTLALESDARLRRLLKNHQ